MAAIVHFSKQDPTIRLGTAGGTTAAEVIDYTVTWANLTDEGFANGDDVIVFFKANLGANSAANNAVSTFGRGSTFAGRTVLQADRIECGSANTTLGAREICFLDRLTLATDDNFYTSIRITSTSTPNIEDYCIFIMKLDDLAADDFRYAETAPSGDAPETATDGASVTLPASGGDDWLVLGNVLWLVDSLTAQMHSRLSLGGNVRMTNTTEGEDVEEQFGRPLIGYLAGAANSAVCTVQYLDAGAGTNDVTRTAIFALRMEAFADHVGNMDQDAIAMGGVIDTYVQTNTVSLALSATGPVAWFAQTIADVGADNQGPYHRVQVDGADIVSALGRRGSHAYDITDQACLTQFGTISMSSGTRVIDVDCAEDTTATAYNFDEHTLVAFSMELAAGGGDVAAIVPTSLALAADLDASGSLSASIATLLTQAADIDAAGALSAAILESLTVAADITAAAQPSDIAATITKSLTPAADLDATGSLSSAQAIGLAVSPDVDSSGALASSQALQLALAADLDASGSLAATIATALNIVADVTAPTVNDISATLATSLAMVSDLDATGSLSSAQAIALTLAADLAAQGRLEVAAAVLLTLAADLNGAGEVSLATALQLSVLADMRAAGLLSLATSLQFTLAADLDAPGQLQAATTVLLAVSAGLTATDGIDLAAIISTALTVSPSMSAPGALATQPALVVSAAIDLAAVGNMNAATTLLFTLAADLDAFGRLDAAPALSLAISADITGPAADDLAVVIPVSLGTMANALTAPGSMLASALVRLIVSAMLFNGAAVQFPNSSQVLLAALYNSFQALDGERVNSFQALDGERVNSLQSLN